MKTQLTKEQSQHLIDSGLKFPYKIAIHDGTNIKTILGEEIPEPKGWYIPIYITDLLEILPKEVIIPMETYLDIPANLVINGFDGEWGVEYEYMDAEKRVLSYIHCETEELIDALYELTIWCIEKGLI